MGIYFPFKLQESSSASLIHCLLSSINSPYWSHAGLHSTGREESGFAAQLPPRFPQVSFNSQHTTRELLSGPAYSQTSCCIRIHISAAKLDANP